MKPSTKLIISTISWSFVIYFSVISFNVYKLEKAKRDNERVIKEYKDQQEKQDAIKKRIERVEFNEAYLKLHGRAKYMTGF